VQTGSIHFLSRLLHHDFSRLPSRVGAGERIASGNPTLSANLETSLGFQSLRKYNDARSVWLNAQIENRRQHALTGTPNPGADDINQEQFDQLLHWLDPDREKAAARYEWIRKRMIKIFVSRGSHIPEELADRTMNRVARKLPEIEASYVGDPAHYFCGVASYIWRESLRKEKGPSLAPPRPSNPSEEDALDYACLEKCLGRLPQAERDLALAYYQQEKHAKIDHRKKLAEKMGIALNALRIRACRIRANLFKCVELCRSEGG
jgi:DNA-directed RNA polymerase specialized sigma24 family protein